jgi:hypothetical protein
MIMTKYTMNNPARATGAKYQAKETNHLLEDFPINIFCGFPIIAAVELTLAA